MVATSRPQPDRAQTAGGRPAKHDSRNVWLLAGIVLLGVIVRFPTLGEQSFWSDEATTYGIVSHGLGHVLATVPKTESTPPLYYVLVWLWSRVFGLREAGLRSFSALCGTLTIPVMWAIGRRLISERVGLVAALLTAVNPFLFWYSQEARAYSLLLLLSAISLLTLVWALERPSARRLLAWSAASALALAAHYFAAFLVVPEAVWLLIALRRAGVANRLTLTSALAPVVVVGAALTPLAIHQSDDSRASFIVSAGGSLGFRAAQLVKQDIVAYDEPLKVVSSLVAVLLVVLAWALVLRAAPGERRGVLLPLVLGVGAVVLPLAAAIIGTDYVDTRNLLESWPALALVVAAGFGAAGAGRIGALGLTALVAVSLACVVGVITDARFQRADWRGATRAMGPVTVPRAIVADQLAKMSFSPYIHGVSNLPSSTAIEEVDVVALVYRRSGARQASLPPRPTAVPSLPGFTMFARREGAGYTVLRYRSPTPVSEQPATLMRLGLEPGDATVALLQKP